MDSLFLLLFACFIFMLINAFFVALSHLHVRWENKWYERSRWMIVAALLGLSIQYVIQMGAASVLLTTVLGLSLTFSSIRLVFRLSPWESTT